MKDYNFFESYQKKRNVNIDVKSPVFLGIIVILLILATSAYLVVQNFVLTAKLSSESEKLATIQTSGEYQEAVKLQDSISAMTQYDQNADMALKRIDQGKVLGTKFLKKLSDMIPSTSSIQSFNITRVSAEFYFYVPNEKAAAELVGDLDKSDLFLQATLISVTKNQDTGNFTAYIKCIPKAGDNK